SGSAFRRSRSRTPPGARVRSSVVPEHDQQVANRDRASVVDAVRSHDRFLLTTHENPDGDALGSLLAMKLALDLPAQDTVMYLAGNGPLPQEYGFMELGELKRQLPPDARERVLVALDCANARRMDPVDLLAV